MYIDAKETIWERFYIPKELENSVKEKIKAGETLQSIIDDLMCEEDIDSEFIYETASFVAPKDGKPTIEVYDKIGECIYSNSKNN